MQYNHHEEHGVLGFLNGGLSCDEVWLPGSWTYRLKDLLNEPSQFTNELLKNLEKHEGHEGHEERI